MADSATTWNDGIKTLGDQIVNLSLLQAKELSDYLKEEHGLEAAAGGAVMMAAPAAGGGRNIGQIQRRCGQFQRPPERLPRPALGRTVRAIYSAPWAGQQSVDYAN